MKLPKVGDLIKCIGPTWEDNTRNKIHTVEKVVEDGGLPIYAGGDWGKGWRHLNEEELNN